MNTFASTGLRWLLVVPALFLLTLTGCKDNSREGAIARLNNTNGKRLASLYTEFQSVHGWKGPMDETEFKEFIENVESQKMEVLGFTPETIDDLFVSDRDSKPFRIRYKVQGSFSASDPVIFEEEGVDGKRMVNFTSMQEREVASDQEFDELWNAKASPPAMRGGDRTPMAPIGREEALNQESQPTE